MNKDIKPYTLSFWSRTSRRPQPGGRLFSRKGYNIESIVSGECGDPGVTRITIVLLGDGADDLPNLPPSAASSFR